MTFKRHHLEAGLTEAHYDMMLPDAEPAPKRRLDCANLALEQTHDCEKLPSPPVPESTPSACARTFNVPELAEEILLHLPPDNLLCRVQRVCRQWRRVVEESELIQQYLFFRPIPYTCDPWVMPTLENPWHYLLFVDTERPTQLDRYPDSSWRGMLLTQPPIEYENGRAWLLQDSVLYQNPWYPNWSTWEAVLRFDTLRQAKKFRRPDERFMELDLAE
ncbi:hypothetical protein CKM354_001266800 [Cercospora kikuchii]|uniref:F-box domain-containing protein n=1 Tax=Cercospora kikuchii TaxID=84275 RepID=A0A9P3FMI9_9PEZI|nr:uncharacterized protein CKM354_001266800 [Cercospora kikuchii]GIZ49639.1 hypothetical protein CKM354_001266800 [Cercospora kikuchii]